jgi:recombination protein RecA
MGLQARLMSQALRKLTAIVSKTNCSVIFINQLRMKIGVMFGNPETTAGGNALKFYASVRLDVRRIAQIKNGEVVIGSRVKVKVLKNKVAPPFKTAEFDIMYQPGNWGISVAGDVLDTGVALGVIEKNGNTYVFGGTKLGVGRENVKTFLREHPDVLSEMDAAVRAQVKSGAALPSTPPESEDE